MESGDRTALVRICDPAGRPRGTGFVADDRGTVLTSHEAVAGLARSVLHGAGGRSRIVEAGDITALPELDLALLPTAGPGELGVEPVPIALRDRIDAGTYVTIAAHGWREARVLGTAPVTYTAHGRSHRIGAALELALGTDGRDALRLGGAAVGGPVLDPESGAVIAVLGSALRAGHPGAFAVPLWAAGTGGPLDALLRRNATSVPGYGRDLNLAGALHLTATSLGSSDGPAACPDPVERPDVVAEFTAFESPDRAATASDGPAVVLGLVGAPGTGRTTELAALTARRARGPVPAPTLWLRGADLLADDTSVADAIARALRRAGRIVTAAGVRGDMASATPERVARLAEESGSPLLVLLDGPEEMPPALAHEPARWTDATVAWLRENGARLVIACGPEHWETAGALCPPEALHRPAGPAGRLPAAVRLGDLTAVQAERARERYAIPPGALAPGHDRHPLTLRLLAEVRAALPGDVAGRPDTEEVFGAHLDLMCLRVAVRIAAASGPAPGGGAVRRLAARVAGQVHEAARRCLGPGQGELDREAFEEVFPWRTGWASAVLTEGLLVPAGVGYRFAHEELGDWVQGAHLDVDAALYALVHRWHAQEGPGQGTSQEPGPTAAGSRVPRPRSPRTGREPAAAVPTRPRTGRDGAPLPDPAARPRAATGPRTLPVPRHRIGPVIQALLLLGRRQGPAALSHQLADLIDALDRLSAEEGPDTETETETADGAVADGTPRHDARWWAVRLLSETLLRVPDARPYLGVLRLLAGRVVRRAATGAPTGPGTYAAFGPWFWRRLRLPEEDRIELFRRLVPADGPHRADRSCGTPPDADGERFLDAVARRLADRPRTVQPLLCNWFTDERPLPAGDGDAMRPTVAAAAQALLYARRDLAVDDLTDALVSTPTPGPRSCSPRWPRTRPPRCAGPSTAGPTTRIGPPAAPPPPRTPWSPRRTPPSTPTASCCADRPWRCWPARRTPPCTGPRSPSSYRTRGPGTAISRRRSGPSSRGVRAVRGGARRRPALPSGTGARRVPGAAHPAGRRGGRDAPLARRDRGPRARPAHRRTRARLHRQPPGRHRVRGLVRRPEAGAGPRRPCPAVAAGHRAAAGPSRAAAGTRCARRGARRARQPRLRAAAGTAAGGPAGFRAGGPPGPGRARRAAAGRRDRLRPARPRPYPRPGPPHRDAAGPDPRGRGPLRPRAGGTRP